jgi:hypothetical protein
MKVPVWVLDAGLQASVRVGELTVGADQLRCHAGKGTISGVVPCEQLRQLLHRRFGTFFGQPFGLKYCGVMMTDCLLTWNNGSSMQFIFTPRPPPLEKVLRGMLAS